VNRETIKDLKPRPRMMLPPDEYKTIQLSLNNSKFTGKHKWSPK